MIRGSHSSGYEELYFLGCNSVADFYWTTLCYILDDTTLHMGIHFITWLCVIQYSTSRHIFDIIAMSRLKLTFS
jgi:hypothetical protein